MTAINIKEKFDQYEYTIKLLTSKVEELAAENERLTSALGGAHATLRTIYSDSTQPAGVRVKAAQAALPHETPRLTPVPPPLDLVAEEVIPLAQLVEQRRARQNALQGRDIEVSPSGAVRILPKPGGNGNGSDEH